MPNCIHPQTLTYCGRKNCTTCSTFISANTPVKGVQQTIMQRKLDIPPALLFDNLVKQQAKKKITTHRQDYALFRKEAIVWLMELTEKLNLSLSTFYTTVSIMDYVLNKHNFPPSKFQVIALVSLIISTKYDELDKNIPMLDDYIRVGKFMYPLELIGDIEALVLKILDYDLKLPHSLVFLELYLCQGVLFSNDTLQPTSGDGRVAELSKYSYYYNMLMLQDCQFSKFDYSKVALTAVLMARRSLGVEPIWNDVFTEITNYQYADVKHCVTAFTDKYEYLVQNAISKIEESGSSPVKELPKAMLKPHKPTESRRDTSYEDKLLLYDDIMNPVNVLMDKDFNVPLGYPGTTMSDTKKNVMMPIIPPKNMNKPNNFNKPAAKPVMKNCFKENAYAH